MPKMPVKKSPHKVEKKAPVKLDADDKEGLVAAIRPAGTVYVEKGVTKNMGDYNSARVTVGITLPVNPSDEDIKEAQATITIANDLLDAELEKQVDALMAK